MGVVRAKWSIKRTQYCFETDDFKEISQRTLIGKRRRDRLMGWLVWNIVEYVEFSVCPAKKEDDFITMMWLKEQLILQRQGASDRLLELPMATVIGEWESRWQTKLDRCHPVSLDPSFATLVMDGFIILHLLPLIFKRRIFRKRILDDGPTTKHLQRWCIQENIFGPNAQLPNDVSTKTESKWGGLSLRKIVTWLDASRFIRKQKQIHDAAQAFENIKAVERGELVRILRPNPKKKNKRHLVYRSTPTHTRQV